MKQFFAQRAAVCLRSLRCHTAGRGSRDLLLDLRFAPGRFGHQDPLSLLGSSELLLSPPQVGRHRSQLSARRFPGGDRFAQIGFVVIGHIGNDLLKFVSPGALGLFVPQLFFPGRCFQLLIRLCANLELDL